MKPTYPSGALLMLVVFLSTILSPNSTCAVFGDEPVAAHIDSQLNETNLEQILDNRDKITDAEIVQMLGPPTSIEVGGPFGGP